MRVKVAKKAGFCMGVRRAMRLALKAVEQSEDPVFTYGPLIHNPQALELLKKLGIREFTESEVGGKGILIIRAHGIPPQEKQKLLSLGLKVVDGTCPRVAKVQKLAQKYHSEGYRVIIIGDKDHAEVKGILGYTDNRGIVVSNFKDIDALDLKDKYVILSQTTQDEELFEVLSQEILRRFPNGEIINTICHATHVRQDCVRNLAKECDTIVVVGGKKSANTNRLAQIAQEEDCKTFLIETPEELDLKELKDANVVGITGGASTPNWVINGVVEKVAAFKNPLRKVWWSLINSHVLLSLSLLLFLLATNFYLEKNLNTYSIISAVLLTFFAHTWNVLVGINLVSLCNPYKANLFSKYHLVFFVSSLLAFAVALYAAYKVSPFHLFYTAISGGLAGVYSITFLRSWFRGNRTIFITLFWWLTVVVFSLTGLEDFTIKTLLVFLFVLSLVFYRTLFIDLLDFFEDGFLGLESLAAALEEKKTFMVLYGSLIFGTIVLLVLTMYNKKFVVMILPLAYALLTIFYLKKRGHLGKRTKLETLVEATSFIYFLSALIFYNLPK